MRLKRILKWTASAVPLALILWGFVAYWMSTNDCTRDVSAPNNPMKAIRYCEYGSPDVVKLDEIEKPAPEDNQVLIKVRAASRNAFGAYVIRDTWLGRLIFGCANQETRALGRTSPARWKPSAKTRRNSNQVTKYSASLAALWRSMHVLPSEHWPRSRRTSRLSKSPLSHWPDLLRCRACARER